VRILKDVIKSYKRVEELAEGRISPHVDVKYVYDYLFNSVRPPVDHEHYCNRSEFLSLTYPTPRMLEWTEVIIRVLAGVTIAKNVFVLPAYFGAGKSHFLAFLIHLISIYSECNGLGECVSKELKKYGINIELPDLPDIPHVFLYHGAHAEAPPWSDVSQALPSKGRIREWISRRKPILIIFDETGMYDDRFGKDFADYMQILSEAIVEAGVAHVLVVSYSLVGSYIPESYERLERISPIRVDLDVVKNIVEVFKRWANVHEEPDCYEVEVSLTSSLEKDTINDFCNRLKETYPFNPLTLRTLLMLAEESLAKATKIQLTRGLLQHMMKAIRNAIKREGKLVIHADLPEPQEVLIPPVEFSKFWTSLINLYKEDVDKLKVITSKHERMTLLSMFKHVFFTSFIGRLLPSKETYPDEIRLLLGNYDPAIDMIQLTNAKRSIDEGHYRVYKTGIGYLYMPVVGDINIVVKNVVDGYASEDGLKVVTNEVEQIAKSVPKFKYVVVAGWRDSDLKEGKLISFADYREVERFLADHADEPILLVDLRGLKIKPRSNLAIVKTQDVELKRLEEAGDILEFLSRFAITPEKLSEALTLLGRIKCAVDEVLNDVPRYFPDVTIVGEDFLKRILEDFIKARLNNIKSSTLSYIKKGVEMWLSRYSIGNKEFSGGLKQLRRYVNETSAEEIVKKVLNSSRNFVRFGDLWSQWLNSGELGYPLSFQDFVDIALNVCKDECQCVLREGNKYQWLSDKNSCEYESPKDPRNAEVALAFINKNPNEDIIEKYLTELQAEHQEAGIRVFIEYSDYVTTRKVPLDQFLIKKTEWIYLRTARIVKEKVVKQFEISVNGLNKLYVEVSRGDPLTIEVSSNEVLMAVEVSLLDEVVKANLRENRKQAVAELKAPQNAGEYELKVSVIFEDNHKENRSIKVKVRGRVKEEKVKTVISESDEVVKMRVFSAKDIGYVLSRLKINKKLLENISEVELTSSVSGETTELNLSLSCKRIDESIMDNLARVVKALESLTETVEIEICFKTSMNLEKSFIDALKTRNVMWIVLEESEI